MKKYIIVAPSYSVNNGGAIVLHKLCHIINQLDREAYLLPIVENLELNKFNYKKIYFDFSKNTSENPLGDSKQPLNLTPL